MDADHERINTEFDTDTMSETDDAPETPIDILEGEHRIILQVIHGLGRVRHALQRGDTVPPRVLHQSAAFLTEFADYRHHVKEEEALFPVILRAGATAHVSLIEDMKAEHEQGRVAINALEKAADDYLAHGPAAHEAVSAAIAHVRTLYVDHIVKEDKVLFPVAERHLDAEAMANLAKMFQQIDERFPRETHEQLVQFAHDLWTTPLNRIHELS